MNIPANSEKPRLLAIVNPAAGGGRCGALATATLARLKRPLDANGISLEVVQTKRRSEATELARTAYRDGVRRFLAVGGDGTSYEIINGVFPESLERGRISLGFLPLGTGNSFLRDFTTKGVEYALTAIAEGRSRPCDVICARHSGGEIYFINVLNLGFPADVAELTNRRFKPMGETGYIFAVFGRLAWLFFGTFPHRVDEGGWDRRPSLFLAFTNSKFTGGKMMIAPKADSADGKIEYVRWAPIGRARLLSLFPRLFTGTHINHPLATRTATENVEFDLSEPVNVVVDGENMKLQLQSLHILPNALDVMV